MQLIIHFPAAMASSEKCCDKKMVGNISYSLVKSGGDVPSDCLNSCVYTQDDDPDKMFCFARGNETVTCREDDYRPCFRRKIHYILVIDNGD